MTGYQEEAARRILTALRDPEFAKWPQEERGRVFGLASERRIVICDLLQLALEESTGH